MSDHTYRQRVSVLLLELDGEDLPFKAICPEHQIIVRGATRASALRAMQIQAGAHLRGVKRAELLLLDLDEVIDG